jgi:hypothetical protein
MAHTCVLIPLGVNGSTMCIQSRIPTCVCPEYWKRHNLSRKDIDTIISYVPTKFLWMSAMLHGIMCPWYTLRSSSASVLEVTLSGKATAVDMILTQLGIQPSMQNKLDTESIESFEHIPPIPKNKISHTDFVHISRGLVSQLLPRSLLILNEPISTVPFIYNHNGIDMIPVGIEGDSICCNAVCKESIYSYHDVKTRGYTHDPKVCDYNGEIYCLTDELVLLCV